MKKIIINKKIEKKLFENAINESMFGDGALIQQICDDLTKSYQGGYMDNVQGTKNKPIMVYFVKGRDGLPLTDHPKTKEAVFRTLQQDYSNIKDGGKERDKFLWDILTHWYNKDFQKHGGIPS